jgi:hypothetical protein
MIPYHIIYEKCGIEDIHENIYGYVKTYKELNKVIHAIIDRDTNKNFIEIESFEKLCQYERDATYYDDVSHYFTILYFNVDTYEWLEYDVYTIASNYWKYAIVQQLLDECYSTKDCDILRKNIPNKIKISNKITKYYGCCRYNKCLNKATFGYQFEPKDIFCAQHAPHDMDDLTSYHFC